MNRQAVTFMGLGLLAIAGSASAQVKTRQVDFTVTYTTASGGGSASHVLKASCNMFEGAPGFAGLDGAPKGATSSGAMGTLQDEMKKCGSDAACTQALMMKMMQNGTMDKAAATLDQKNYTLWTPTTCTGSLTVDDRSARTGTDAMSVPFSETVTIKGAADVRPWQGLAIQHDLKKGVSEYRFTPPESVVIDRTLVRTGAGATTEKNTQRVAAYDPKATHAVPGAPKSGKAVSTTPGGTVTFEWTVVR